MEMLNLMVKGAGTTETVRDIAAKYNRTEGGIWADWTRRETWIPKLIRLDGGTTHEILQGVREVWRRAWFTHATAEYESTKLGALKLVMEAYTRFIDIAQSAGLLERVPEKIEMIKSVDQRLTVTLREYAPIIRELTMGKDDKNTKEPMDPRETPPNNR